MSKKSIAIVGAGPSAVYLFDQLVQKATKGTTITIIDAAESLTGAGMPYRPETTNEEHMANISCQQIPPLPERAHAWLLRKDDAWFAAHNLNRDVIDGDFLMPRLVLGEYLADQLQLLIEMAENKGLHINVISGAMATDVTDLPESKQVKIDYTQTRNGQQESTTVDHVVLATGHEWRAQQENLIPGYFDSPWPASKLAGKFNHAVGLLGSSLSAIDVTMTMAKNHGHFERDDNDGVLRYIPDPGTEDFKLVMHSRHGLLPNLRSYYEDETIDPHKFISEKEIRKHIRRNDGFLSLDMLFDRVYREPLAQRAPEIYDVIKDMSIEEIIEHMYAQEKYGASFDVFRDDYARAQNTYVTKCSLHERDLLEDFSYALTFYAKYLGGEDMMRVKQTMMPFISLIVASLPLPAAEKLIALNEAGKLDLLPVGHQSVIAANENKFGATVRYTDDSDNDHNLQYDLFVDCRGQERRPVEQFPFPTLVKQGVVTEARLRFHFNEPARKILGNSLSKGPVEKIGDDYFYDARAIAVDDQLRPLNDNGQPHPRVTLMSNTYIGGLYPDHSGLPFCSDAARLTVKNVLRTPKH